MQTLFLQISNFIYNHFKLIFNQMNMHTYLVLGCLLFGASTKKY